jgi:hypothetical protein
MNTTKRQLIGILFATATFFGAAAAQRNKPRPPAPKPTPTATPIPMATPVPTPTPTPTPTKEQIIDAVDAQAKTYVETFKNLLADETKTFEMYGKNAEVKKRRVVTSSFIVFPLMKSEGQSVEFRNVTSVDGKKISDSDQRASDLFTKLSSADTSETEINRLRDESSRHDLDIAISGMTLFQAIAFDKGLRDMFDFDIRPTGPGSATLTIDYRQVRDSPDITINAGAARPAGRPGLNYDIDMDKEVPLAARLNGTAVVDAATYRLISETRNVTIRPEGSTAPITVVEDQLEYQDGPFGVFTPKRITHTQYLVRSKEMRAEKQAKITFEYGNFTRPGVDVKAGDVKQ